jgi:hypothetical protein
MTKEEADQVAAILSSADGGCSVCSEQLAKAAEVTFPIEGFSWCDRVMYWREEWWRTSTSTSEAVK